MEAAVVPTCIPEPPASAVHGLPFNCHTQVAVRIVAVSQPVNLVAVMSLMLCLRGRPEHRCGKECNENRS